MQVYEVCWRILSPILWKSLSRVGIIYSLNIEQNLPVKPAGWEFYIMNSLSLINIEPFRFSRVVFFFLIEWSFKMSINLISPFGKPPMASIALRIKAPTSPQVTWQVLQDGPACLSSIPCSTSLIVTGRRHLDFSPGLHSSGRPFLTYKSHNFFNCSLFYDLF